MRHRIPSRVEALLAQEKSVGYKGFAAKVRRARCPRCKTKGRLLTGPFYDRGRLTCQECGHKLRVKVK